MQASDAIFVPFRCPNCKDSCSFETLKELRSHLQAKHDNVLSESASQHLGSNFLGGNGRNTSPVLELFRADAIQIEQNLRSFKESELNNKRQREELSRHSNHSPSRVPMDQSNRSRARHRGEDKLSSRNYGHPSRIKYKFFKRQDKNRRFSSPDDYQSYPDDVFPDEDFVDDSNPHTSYNINVPREELKGRIRPKSVDRIHNVQGPITASWSRSNENLSFRRKLQSHGAELDTHVQETVSALSQEVVMGRSTQQATLDSLRTSHKIFSQLEQSAQERINRQQETIASLAVKLSEKEEQLSDILLEMRALKKQHVEEIEVKNVLNQKSTYEREKLLQDEISHKQKELESLSERLDIARQAVLQYRGEIKEGKAKLSFKPNNDAPKPIGNITKSNFDFKNKRSVGGIKTNNDDLNIASDNEMNDDDLVRHNPLPQSSPTSNQMSNEITPKEMELSRLRSKSKQLETDRQTLLLEMHTLLETAATDNEKLRMELANQGKQLTKLNLELERSKQEQSELLGETNTLYYQADLSLTRLKQMLEDKDGQLSTVTGQLEKAKEMQNKLIKEREDYLKLTDEKESKYQSLVQENAIQLQTMKQSLTESQVEKTRLEGKMFELKEELQKKEKHDEQMEERLQQMETQLSTHEDWQVKMLEQINDKEDRLQKAKAAMEKMNTFLSDAADKELETRSKLEQFISALVDRSAQAEAELQNMKLVYAAQVQARNEAALLKAKVDDSFDFSKSPDRSSFVDRQNSDELLYNEDNRYDDNKGGYERPRPSQGTHLQHTHHGQRPPSRSQERNKLMDRQNSDKVFLNDGYGNKIDDGTDGMASVNQKHNPHSNQRRLHSSTDVQRIKPNNRNDDDYYRHDAPENSRLIAKKPPDALPIHSNINRHQNKEMRSPPKRRVKNRPLLLQGKEFPYSGSNVSPSKSKLSGSKDRKQMENLHDDARFDRRVQPNEDGRYDRRVPPNEEMRFDRRVPPNAEMIFDRRVPPNEEMRYDRRVSLNEEMRFDRRVPPNEDARFDRTIPPNEDARFERKFPPNEDTRLERRAPHNEDARFDRRIQHNGKSIFLLEKDGPEIDRTHPRRSNRFPAPKFNSASERKPHPNNKSLSPTATDKKYGLFRNTPEVNEMYRKVKKTTAVKSDKNKRSLSGRNRRLSSEFIMDDDGIIWESFDYPELFKQRYSSQDFKQEDGNAIDDYQDSLYSHDMEQHSHEESEEDKKSPLRMKKSKQNKSRPRSRKESPAPLGDQIVKVLNSIESSPLQSSARKDYYSESVINKPIQATTSDSLESSPVHRAHEVQKRVEKLTSSKQDVASHPLSRSKGQPARLHGSVNDLIDRSHPKSGFTFRQTSEPNHTDGAAGESDFSFTSYASLTLDGGSTLAKNNSVSWLDDVDSVAPSSGSLLKKSRSEERRNPKLHVIKRGSSDEQMHPRDSSLKLDNLDHEKKHILARGDDLHEQNRISRTMSRNESEDDIRVNDSSDGLTKVSQLSRSKSEDRRDTASRSFRTQRSREEPLWFNQDQTLDEDSAVEQNEMRQTSIKRNNSMSKSNSSRGYDLVMKELVKKYPYRDTSDQAQEDESEPKAVVVVHEPFNSTKYDKSFGEQLEESTDNAIISSDEDVTLNDATNGSTQKAIVVESVEASTDTDLEKLSRPGFLLRGNAGRKRRHQLGKRSHVMRSKQAISGGYSDMSNWTSTDTNDFDETDQEERWTKRCRRVALFCVLNYVDTYTLLVASQVCREWRKISHHPTLWKRVVLRNHSIGPEFLITMSQWCSQTESLSLTGLIGRPQRLMESEEEHQVAIRGSLESGLERFLFACQGSLQTLIIENCDSILTDKCLWLISGNCRMLTSLCYRSAEHPATPQLLWALGGGCPGITTLKIHPVHRGRQLGAMNNRFLLFIGQFYRDLLEVGLGGTDFDMAGLIPMIQACQRLRVIHLDNCLALTDDLATAMCRAGLKDLQTLMVTGAVYAKALETLQRNCRHLRKISVSVNIEDFDLDSSKRKDRNNYKKLIQELTELRNKAGLSHILTVVAEETD